MAALNAISSDKLFRLIGTPGCPVIIDLREAAVALLPAALPRNPEDVAGWANEFRGQSVVVACEDGRERGAGVAAFLRSEGVDAEMLEGGVAAWRGAGFPLIDAARLPNRDGKGRTVWVTRARPKVDRIACPWLIRRFVDPAAVFLFVAPGEVAGVAEEFGAAAFDTESAAWSDRDERCTFDAMIDGFGLGGFVGLARLAEIVRGADTGRQDLAPQSAGLLALSLGLSRTHSDDLAQLEDGMVIYDALYRWCRDAIEEVHDTSSHKPKAPVLKPA